MVYPQIIKKVIPPETLNKFRFALVNLRCLVGIVLIGAFVDMEISAARSDFVCHWTGNVGSINFIRTKCYHQYREQNHKLKLPPYLFILFHVILILTVTVAYSQCVKSTVNELKCNREEAEGERSNRRILFIAYLFQLVVSIVLEITFIVLLEAQLFYPRNFPSDFLCSIKNPSFNRTQSTNLFHCLNQRAYEKNVWTQVAIGASGIFASFAFLEIIWILSRARNDKKFMDNWQFCADHLKSKSDEPRLARAEAIPLVEPQLQPSNIQDCAERPEHAQAQKDVQSAIQTLKDNCLQGTQQPSDLKQPFRRPNPGEGHIHDLTLDEIYVNLAIHEGRPHHNFAKDLDRWEQLKEYTPDEKDCQFGNPEDIIDLKHKNVLVVGHPGIGKTSLSTKMLRLWAKDEAFKDFNVAFLVKFSRFNVNAKLSFRELLARAETVQCLDDFVWDIIKTEPSKVLLIFDGVGKDSRKEDIKAQKADSTYNNDVEEKMPVSVLYNKVAAGKLLRGASIGHNNNTKSCKICGTRQFSKNSRNSRI